MMKLLVVVAALVACVAGSALPYVPKDNSHYVEGESRYLWVTEGDGDILVDLHEPVDADLERDIESIEYWLYTEQNPETRQVIVNGDLESVRSSNYDSSKPSIFLFHGFTQNGNSRINRLITSAFLAVKDVNMFVVNWGKLASGSYVNAITRTPAAGRSAGSFISWLINTTGASWNNVHIIGFSLGGQIAGNAGRAIGGWAGRFTALDAVSPAWYNNFRAAGRDAAQYTEFIHTYHVQENPPLNGHADFYPNGGESQPGCLTNICSHTRAFELFASSVRTDHFEGRQCADVQQARDVACTGATLNMGNSIRNKRGNGIFGLTTRGRWPF